MLDESAICILTFPEMRIGNGIDRGIMTREQYWRVMSVGR